MSTLLAEHLLLGVAEQALGGGIEGLDAPVWSMAMMPSMAESTMARQRASLACSS